MYQIDKETKELILESGTCGDYDIPEELDHWTVDDFEDVLPSHKSVATDEFQA